MEIVNTSLTKKTMNDTMGPNREINAVDPHGNVIQRKPKNKKEKGSFDYATYANIGFYLAAPLLILLFLGLQLDKWFHTKPVFVLIGIVVGAIASLYNLIRLTKKDASH